MYLKIAQINIMRKQAQGLGPPGGMYLTGLALSDKFGGPRWYPYETDENLSNFIRNQYRYRPNYVPIGEALEFQDESDWKLVKEIDDLFFGKDPQNIDMIVSPERKEKAVLLMIDKKDNEFRAEELPVEFQDVVKEIKNWKFMVTMNKTQDGYMLYARKVNPGGDTKGIFEINGEPAAPGFGYIWRDGPSATPSNNKHGDLTENLWENWKSPEGPGSVLGHR
jgi:hypothetical protein